MTDKYLHQWRDHTVRLMEIRENCDVGEAYFYKKRNYVRQTVAHFYAQKGNTSNATRERKAMVRTPYKEAHMEAMAIVDRDFKKNV